MKTSEIAGIIEHKNLGLHIGGVQLFLPLPPVTAGPRTLRTVGWVAFNLIRIVEAEHSVILDPTFPPAKRTLWFNRKSCTFALMKSEAVPSAGTGWEEVEFDGYGGLETWKELSR